MSFGLKRSWPRNPVEVYLLAKVFAMLLKMKLTVSEENLGALASRLGPVSLPAAQRPERLDRIVGFADGLCWRIPYFSDKRCLPRSLTLYHFARQCGFPVRLHCGVRKTETGGLDGHAWLSLDGEVFRELDDRADSFTVTFSYPEGNAPDAN